MKQSVKFISALGLFTLLLIGGGVLVMTANTHSGNAAGAGPAGGPPPAMPVETVIVQPENVQIWKNFSGSVVAVDRAEIKPQVNGRITEIMFEDGEYVEKGDTLIVIDPRPYKAALDQAKAALQTAKTNAVLAEKEYERAQKLIKTDAISQGLLDERRNKTQSAKAMVEGAKAAVQSAEINLDYAYVKAPISGKVSRAEITEGNLVQSGSNAPILTTIVASNRVYVDFEIDELTYVNLMQTIGTGKVSTVPVRVKLPASTQEYKGTIRSFDNRIDPLTGTVRARAVFDNSHNLMLPGMSVTVLMGDSGDKEQVVITERAIGTDQDRKFVYVINDGTAMYREIKIGESFNGKRVVLSGLSSGEQIISDGIVKIRPGMPVQPKSQASGNTSELQAIPTASGH